MTVKLTLVGGPTALLEYAGLRWLTNLGGNAVGLEPWSRIEVERSGGDPVRPPGAARARADRHRLRR